MNYLTHEDKITGNVMVKEECSLEFENCKPQGFGNKLIELFGLQNVPADTDDHKVFIPENDQELSQIIIKEEIVLGPTLRRSSRRRCPLFSLDNLQLESSSDESVVSEHGKKARLQTASLCICEEKPRLLMTGCAQLPEGRSKSSDRCTTHGKTFEQFCSICGRWFSRIGYLRRHAATHSKSETRTCNRRGKSFSHSDRWRERERPSDGENYRCSVCGREFSQAGRLKVHVRAHTGERPYSCDVCGKAFRVSGSLRDHERIHTGERPFTCHVCGKSFRQAAHLRGHARLHTGERRHGCDVCGRLFFRRTHLKLHACVRSAHRQRCRKVQC